MIKLRAHETKNEGRAPIGTRRLHVNIQIISDRINRSAELNSYSPAGENPAWGKASHHLRTEPHTQIGNNLM